MNTAQRNQIRQLLQDPKWQTVEQLADEICLSIQTESAVRETEWLSLKQMLTQEGQVQGIKRLIKELYMHAQK